MITPFLVGRRRPLERVLRGALIHGGFNMNAAASADLDLTDEQACRRALVAAGADIVIDCSGADDEDPDESAEELGRMLVGIENLARAAAAVGAHSVYISSARVFDREGDGPHLESDLPIPTSALGLAIRRAERTLARINEQHTIVRTGGLYTQDWLGPLGDLITRTRSGGHLFVAPHPICPPTYAVHLADVLVKLVRSPCYGIIHRAATGACNELDLARAVVAMAGIQSVIEAIADTGPASPRSCLESRRDELPAIPHWRIGLRAWSLELAGTRSPFRH